MLWKLQKKSAKKFSKNSRHNIECKKQPRIVDCMTVRGYFHVVTVNITIENHSNNFYNKIIGGFYYENY